MHPRLVNTGVSVDPSPSVTSPSVVFELTDLALARLNAGTEKKQARTDLPLRRPWANNPEKKAAAAQRQRQALLDSVSGENETLRGPEGTWVSETIAKPHRYDGLSPGMEQYHKNYLFYLIDCYASHYGAVVTPEILWHTLMTGFAGHIKANADHYRHLFTKSPDQVEITVLGGVFPPPINQFTAALRDLIPTAGAVDLFCPKFASATPMGRVAGQAAFCDAMQVYYEYGVFLCGIPRVRVEGSLNDWDLVRRHTDLIIEALDLIDDDWKERLQTATHGVVGALQNPEAEESREFWNKMLWAPRCGSGGDVEVHGWYSNLFETQPDGIRKPSNFPAAISVVPYTDMTQGEDLTGYWGVFQSRFDEDSEGNGDWLIPEFSVVIESRDEDYLAQLKTQAQVRLDARVAARGR